MIPACWLVEFDFDFDQSDCLIHDGAVLASLVVFKKIEPKVWTKNGHLSFQGF